MEESRDPAIKLFGKTIPLRPSGEAPTIYGEEGGGNGEKDLVNIGANPDSKHQDDDSPNPQDRSELTTSFMVSQAQEQSADHDTPVKNSEPDEQENDASKSQEETPKKPDKILPCPRCKSLDTKFCYFNNYNANQPRHFCKNCQRYWTAGGTMRNVPVGAGRRKNKNTASHYRTITVSDAILQTVRPDIPDPIRHPPLKASGTVLNFGSDVPLCESMASVLKDPEKTNNCIRNGFHRTEDQMAPLPVVENGDEHSSGSSVTASSSIDDGTGDNSQQPAIQNHPGFAPQIPYFNGSPWAYHWAPAPFCSSSFPMSFYPATAYWGCTAPGTWSIPWLSPPLASFPINGSSESGPNSPTLGKHSREGDELKHSNSDNRESLDQSKQERSLWMPKTLRIDDPEAAAAAKSSIWATMGFKNDKADTTNAGGLFKSFHEKDNVKNHMAETPQVFHANPAALSRSLNFQESSY